MKVQAKHTGYTERQTSTCVPLFMAFLSHKVIVIHLKKLFFILLSRVISRSVGLIKKTLQFK